MATSLASISVTRKSCKWTEGGSRDTGRRNRADEKRTSRMAAESVRAAEGEGDSNNSASKCNVRKISISGYALQCLHEN